MSSLWNKLKTWLGVIPLTIILVVIIALLVYLARLPLKSFIESIQRGLRKGGREQEQAHATQISEENNSVVPDAPKNYKQLEKDSTDNTEKVLQILNQTLETLKNVKTSP